MLRDNKHIYLDHDFVETSDGWIFGVVSNIHPPGRILSYLKYVPGEGVWTRDGIAYKRVLTSYAMREIIQSIELVRRAKPQFLYTDPATGEEFIYVPVDKVVKHYRCEERLREIMQKPVNKHEQTCVKLVRCLSEETGVEEKFFGVSGSLLLKLRNPAADIDLVIYGGENFRKVVKASAELQTRQDRAATTATLVKNYMSKYPITQADAEKLAERCLTRGYFEATPYSLHAVKTLRETTREYGSVISRHVGTIKTKLKILNVSEAVFTPAVYDVEDLGRGLVEKLVCFDTTFAGLFVEGDVVETFGKLERVHDLVENKSYHSIVVGSVKTADTEYVKLSETV